MAGPRQSCRSRLTNPLRLLLRAPIAALFRVRVEGRNGLPSGPLIAAGVPHRTWIEPVLMVSVLPAARRVMTVADGPTVTRSWVRRAAVRAVGGAISVGRRHDRSNFAAHVEAVRSAIGAGSIVAIYPETGPPKRPPEVRRLSAGIAHFAAATQAPVVPIVFGGTGDLYLRRRIVVRILSPLAPPPPSATIAELDAWMAQLRELVQAAAKEVEAGAGTGEPRTKRWRWLSGNFPRAD